MCIAYKNNFHLCSVCLPGVHSTSICDLTLQYLIQLCAEDILVIEGQENSVGCVLCVLTTAFTALEDKSKLVVSGMSVCPLDVVDFVSHEIAKYLEELHIDKSDLKQFYIYHNSGCI